MSYTVAQINSSHAREFNVNPKNLPNILLIGTKEACSRKNLSQVIHAIARHTLAQRQYSTECHHLNDFEASQHQEIIHSLKRELDQILKITDLTLQFG